MKKTTLTATLATALLIGPLPASAQTVPGTATLAPAQWGQGRAVQRNRFEQMYSQGYRAGLREGERDARGRRGRDYGRHNDYRRGGGWGNSRGGEADAFRRGFADGYGEAYSRFDRGWNNRAPNRGYPSYPTYPSNRGQAYPGGGYGGGGYGGGYYSPAAQRGFDEGYREGMNAGRGNDRYDPVREKRYREGDSGYNSRFGSREQYKQEYRNAFRQGYDRGYREARYR
jgi:hypothetical protein